jgi:ornithine carbamoyltransferase
MTSRSYLGVLDFDADETRTVLQRAAELKQRWNAAHQAETVLLGSTLAGVYEKPSLRTRVTFEAGMAQLGGTAVYLGPNDLGLGTRESAADVARGLGRWVQIIAARTFAHSTVEQLAAHAGIPVINALSDREHPCQALADFLTLRERLGRIEGMRLAYVGDGNNVAHSLLLMGTLLGTNVTLATPAGYEPQPYILQQAQRLAAESDAMITVTHDPYEAVHNADAVYTDVWASMGQEAEAGARTPVFMPYQVTADLLAASGKPHTIFMHCLPAHRGEEVTADVVDGPLSVVFDQAENRLHVQKALILHLLGK